jgi:hypothetical protein
LLNRYGETGISLNLMRSALAPKLTRTRVILNTLGQELLAKANLLFNRPFYIYLGGVCQRKTFYSSVLIELVSSLAEASQALEQVISELKLMIPHSIANAAITEEAVDLRLATYLGFEGLSHRTAPLAVEKRLVRRTAEVFQNLAEGLGDVIRQLRSNHAASNLSTLAMTCQSMQGEVARLMTFKLPEEPNLEAWDHFRHSLLGSILQLNANLTDLATELPLVLQLPSDPTQGKLVYPLAAKRQLVNTLMIRGIAAADAKDASEALVKYCQNHSVNPRQILAGELVKVHPKLDPEALSVLAQAAPDQPIDSSGAEEKNRAHRESTRLGHLLTKWNDQLTPLLAVLMAMIVIGCGVKKDPVSDIDDYRPRIPFRGPLAPDKQATISDIRREEMLPAEPPAPIDTPIPLPDEDSENSQ